MKSLDSKLINLDHLFIITFRNSTLRELDNTLNKGIVPRAEAGPRQQVNKRKWQEKLRPYWSAEIPPLAQFL